VAISILTPRNIKLDDGRLLFSAISHVGDRLIFVGCHYFDNPIAYERLQFRLIPSTEKASDLRYHARVDYEPCVIITAHVGAGPIEVEFYYEGQTWNVPLKREHVPRSRLSLMTLFKDDYRLLPEFIGYYTNLGVDNFYLYFNGPLKRIDWDFLRACAKTRDIGVQLVEWDIPYWWNLGTSPNKGIYESWGYQHHAQPMAMNHHLHFVRGSSDYTLFVDLDEYVFTPKATLDRCLEAKPGFVVFQSWWTSFSEPVPYESFSISEDRELLVAETGEGRARVKSLVKPEVVDLMGIHMPYRHGETDNRFIDGFFHFFRFKEHDRQSVTTKGLKRCLKSDFVRQRFSRGPDVEADGAGPGIT